MIFSKLSDYRSSLFFIFFLVFWTFYFGHLLVNRWNSKTVLKLFPSFATLIFFFSHPPPILCCFSSLLNKTCYRCGIQKRLRARAQKVGCLLLPCKGSHHSSFSSGCPRTCKKDSQKNFTVRAGGYWETGTQANLSVLGTPDLLWNSYVWRLISSSSYRKSYLF